VREGCEEVGNGVMMVQGHSGGVKVSGGVGFVGWKGLVRGKARVPALGSPGVSKAPAWLRSTITAASPTGLT